MKPSYQQWGEAAGSCKASAWRYYKGLLPSNSPLNAKFRAALEQIEREQQEQKLELARHNELARAGADLLQEFSNDDQRGI